MPDPTTLGEAIRQTRCVRGLTQGELARQAGVSGAHLCRIEAGTAEPGLHGTLAICEVLGVSAETLIALERGEARWELVRGAGVGR